MNDGRVPVRLQKAGLHTWLGSRLLLGVAPSHQAGRVDGTGGHCGGQVSAEEAAEEAANSFREIQGMTKTGRALQAALIGVLGWLAWEFHRLVDLLRDLLARFEG